METLRSVGHTLFRFLVYARRYAIALSHTLLPPKSSYAQHGEDSEMRKLLEGLDLDSGVYVDVGANHPTLSSNTYLFYRNQSRGVLVEPDGSNCWLLRHFRPRDITIRALCGSNMGLRNFNYSRTSAHNSVLPMAPTECVGTEYIPQVTIDEIARCLEFGWVYLMSIDVEGADLLVLQGAQRTLKDTLLVCVEIPGGGSDSELHRWMEQNGFRAIFSNQTNVVFENTLTDLRRRASHRGGEPPISGTVLNTGPAPQNGHGDEEVDHRNNQEAKEATDNDHI